MFTYYTYILSNFTRTVLYIGVTSNLQIRVWQHRNGDGGVFTSKYNCHDLLYYEEFVDINEAIAREKNLKTGVGNERITSLNKTIPNLKTLQQIGLTTA